MALSSKTGHEPQPALIGGIYRQWGNVLDFVIDETVDVAETVVRAVLVDRLKAALPLLSNSEQMLIQAIFFEELSEREVGLRLGVTQSVVNKRKAKILAKLRKIIENKI